MRYRLTRELVRDGVVERIETLSGQKLMDCYQCGRCSAGCPVVAEMDMLPSEVIRRLQVGQVDRVLASKTIWICASCLQCASRCPKGVEFSSICDALRQTVLRKRISTPNVDADDVTTIMVSDAPQLGVVGALKKLNG
jgi:heterodisulfide reductase subunit C